jgi:isopenicillin-N N-acyltransferase-like protein
MRKLYRIAILGLLLPATQAAWAASVEVVATSGAGALLRVNGQRVLRLEGPPYELGRQHGTLLRDDIRAMVGRVLLIANAAGGDEQALFAGNIQRAWERCLPYIDKRYLEELRGLADGAGVSLEQIQQANIFPELFHCSGFALMGGATIDGRLLHGRILDYMTEIGLQAHAVTLVVIPEGRIPFLNVGFAGFIGSVTGMNARQVAIGEMGGRGEGQWDGVPMAFLVREALERANTLDEALAIFKNSKRTCEYYYVISDAKIPDARGLCCTPDVFQTIAPGESHERLPRPVKDTVLLSANERYNHLVDRVQTAYGRIGPPQALKIMERPVAMESNLHCVLFDASRADAYVAVAAEKKGERFQACFQPYARINLKEVMATRIGRGSVTSAPASTAPAVATSQPAGPRHLEGKIAPSQTRPMRPTDDAALAALLKKYEPPPGGFAWSADRIATMSTYDVYDLRFPSPFTSAVPENNTVPCEYYRCRGDQKRPAVIVLHILDGRFRESRMICNYLASQGVDGVLLKMAYYGPRRPQDPERQRRLTQDLDTLVEGVHQTVMDVRRLAQWLQYQPHIDAGCINVLGVSLGGFVGSLAAGVDGRFSHSIFILAGGNLAEIFRTHEKEVRPLREAVEAQGLTQEQVVEKLALIEPCTYAGRIDGRTVLMVNTDADPIVPRACAEALANRIGDGGVKIVWFEGDHYGLLWKMFEVLGRVKDHIAKQ